MNRIALLPVFLGAAVGAMAQVLVDVPVGEVIYVRPEKATHFLAAPTNKEADPRAREEARQNVFRAAKPALRGRIGSGKQDGGLAPMAPDMNSLRRAQVVPDWATGSWTLTMGLRID